MLVVAAILLILFALVIPLLIRARALPPPEPISPTLHLEERKATIYENLRDLQNEYRIGKLSDEDYQKTKLDLQKELAAVMAEIDRVMEENSSASGSNPAPDSNPAPSN